MSQNFPDFVENKLISALPQEEYQRLLPNLEPISLSFKQSLYKLNQPIDYVYFLINGVASVLIILEDGGTVEVATVGSEGMIGTPILLGDNRFPGETIVQVPGNALRIQADVFQSQVPPGSIFHNILLRYVQVLINQLMQTVACNRLHTLEERCSRWLLMTQDRANADEFPMTQEFLSQMLGVRRASVSVTAAILQKAGLIRYHRGRMRVLDRQGLEASSCECYQVIKQEYERLMA